MVNKVCKKCLNILPPSEFNKNKLYKDGLRSDCKACQKSYNKEHRSLKKEHYKEFDKERAATKGRREELAKARVTHRQRHPDRYKARNAVSNAIRDGRLYRPDYCLSCLKPCIPDGHHFSYEKDFWLEVDWLCKECHQELHREEEN